MTKEDILHHFQDINFYYNDCMMYDDLSRMLDELIAENKGEWIFYDEEFYPQNRFASVHHRIRECSICHHKIADFVGNMNFCPNCGTDMRGASNDKRRSN